MTLNGFNFFMMSVKVNKDHCRNRFFHLWMKTWQDDKIWPVYLQLVDDCDKYNDMSALRRRVREESEYDTRMKTRFDVMDAAVRGFGWRQHLTKMQLLGELQSLSLVSFVAISVLFLRKI